MPDINLCNQTHYMYEVWNSSGQSLNVSLYIFQRIIFSIYNRSGSCCDNLAQGVLINLKQEWVKKSSCKKRIFRCLSKLNLFLFWFDFIDNHSKRIFIMLQL